MSRRSLPLALLLSAVLLVPLTSAGAQDAQDDLVVEAARQVTTGADPVRLFVTPALAVAPDDPSTVVLVAGDARNGGCGIHVSRDGGLSWRTTARTVMPDDLPFCVQRNFGPVVAPRFASDGTLYVGVNGSTLDTETPHPNGPITGLLVRSEDLGVTHETLVAAEPKTVEVESDGVTEDAFQQWRIPSLAVHPNDPDTVYMGWRLWMGTEEISFSALPQRSYVAVTRDGGQTWSDPVDIIAEGVGNPDELGLVLSGAGQTHSDTPSMVVDSDGTAYAFTKERPPRGDEPMPARIFMGVSTDNGQTWDTRVINEGANNLDTPFAAIDPSNDNLYITYASRGEERTDPSQVYFQASTDGGETWSEPANLSDPGQSSGFNKYFPGMSVAPNGRIDVAWHDYQNDPFFEPGGGGPMGQNDAERYSDIYYTFSEDGGRSWSTNTRVTDRSIDRDVGVTFNNQALRGPIGVASTDAAAYFTWPDSRAGTSEFEVEDAYFTRVRFPAAEGVAATGGSNNVVWSLIGAAVALALGGLVLVAGTRMAGRPRTSGGTAARERAPKL